jgi:molybdopterin adenylyltransferase
MSHPRDSLSPLSAGCAIITVSDTRTEANDFSGQAIRDLLISQGHSVCSYVIVKDEPDQVRHEIQRLAMDNSCQAVLINGGTGISARDRTYEAVVGMLDKRLDGFGELFRMLSFEQIGSRAMLSRAVGGVYANRVVFCMPGSTAAARLAMTRLILPELGHLLWELRKTS